jgi:hypothetical protein
MTDLNEPGGFLMSVPREAANSAVDFANFVDDLLTLGHLVAGDVLIMDNAAIHVAALPHLNPILADAGVTLRLLPTYSPELNPCELIFAMIKQRMRSMSTDLTLFQKLVVAAAYVETPTVVDCYRRCICDFSLS